MYSYMLFKRLFYNCKFVLNRIMVLLNEFCYGWNGLFDDRKEKLCMMYNKKDLINEINKILLYYNIILLIIKICVVLI